MQPNAATRIQPDERLLADAQALQLAVTELVRLYQLRDREKICCHDISVTQCWALEALIERGDMNGQALADALRLDKSTTSRVVDALERKGYVERTPDLADRRAVLLRVTRSGRGLHQRIQRDLVAQQAEILRDLPPAVRSGATDVVRRLVRAARSQFVTEGAMCAPGRSTGCGS